MEMGSEIRMLCSNEKNVSQEGTFRCDQNGTWESINHAVQKCRCIQVDKFHLNTDKFSNDCYQYVEQAKTKDLAEGFCRNQTFGGHLVFPFTASSKSFACGLVSKDEAVWVGGEWTNIHTINTSLGNISAKSVTGLSSFKGSGCLALNCMSQTMTVQNCGRSLPFMCGIEAVETP
ncbi:snaclec agglucetin subunit alpha-1-like [Ostrea edulis]|uniref:snaclec agglucetin subunit alpha-1-like n=1 Tax=Ostrea edulis TaxID=37623 RepID=UPI002095ACAC|nr:snaclec agglucetin subunit alpha-1-like [Ostrea edulis]